MPAGPNSSKNAACGLTAGTNGAITSITPRQNVRYAAACWDQLAPAGGIIPAGNCSPRGSSPTRTGVWRATTACARRSANAGWRVWLCIVEPKGKESVGMTLRWRRPCGTAVERCRQSTRRWRQRVGVEMPSAICNSTDLSANAGLRASTERGIRTAGLGCRTLAFAIEMRRAEQGSRGRALRSSRYGAWRSLASAA